jgi:hypothetical protein
MAMTNFLANQIANATLRNTSYTSPASVYGALYTTAPTASTSGTELSGNGYSRVALTFDTPANGSASTSASATFGPASTAAWTGVKAVGVCDASSGGNILYYQTIATRNVKVGDSLVFGTGNVTISLS